MARAEPPASLNELRNPQSTQSHVAALKALKHDIIGHEQRKELAIHHGVVVLLKRNLAASATSATAASATTATTTTTTTTTTTSTAASSATSDKGARRRDGAEQEEVLTQTVQIVTCLAHGGLAFVRPLVHSGIVAHLLDLLSPSAVPARLVVEALRAVTAIAEALATDVLVVPETSGLAGVAALLFSKPHVDTLVEILAQRHESAAVDEQITLLLRCIALCLRDGQGVQQQHQPALVKAGVLDYICCRLAALVARMGNANMPLDPAFVRSMLPAPPRASLQYLLEALACLCYKSAYRSMRIVYSRHLLNVFPVASPRRHASGDYYYYHHLSLADQSSPLPPPSMNPIDHFLPKLQAVQSKNEHSFAKAFPALGSFSSTSDGLGGGGGGGGGGGSGAYYGEGQTLVSGRTISADEFGSPLIAWLIHIARHSTGLERLAALEFLAKLISALDQKIMDSWAESSRNRDRTLAFLVVPLLVRIIDAADPKNSTATLSADEKVATRLIRERAPIALAILISDAPALQKAAHDAQAITVFSQALKKSFDTVSAVRQPMWTSTPINTGSSMDLTADGLEDPMCTLAPPSLPVENIHRFRSRAASMEALAALAAANDTYRKSIIDSNITTCLIDSLTPYSDGPVASMTLDAKDGNPWFVVAAACKLATALSRCVGVLRTKLLDAGLAKPVFRLLGEREYRLKSAGLDAATNLLLHFSPMREDLINQGVIKIICAHAHSADPELRLSALWALRNLCASAPKDVRLQIVEELGTGWLIQIMAGESSLPSSSSVSYMSTPNAAGEQVDLLNAMDTPNMEIDDADEEEGEDDDNHGEGEEDYLDVPSQHRARLRAIRHEEESPTLRARKSDIRIQTKVIDLVRNVICDAGPKQPDMVDTILSSFGQTRLFDVLASKLKPRASSSASSSSSATRSQGERQPAGKRPTLTVSGGATGREEKDAAVHAARIESFPSYLYPDSEVLNNTLFTLIHIANGRPAHRHMLLNLATSLPPTQAPSSLFPPNWAPPKFLPHPSPTTKLLDLTLPLFWHPDPRIRTACCWMIHNILWIEDSADTQGARQRAQELRSRAFEEAVASCATDANLDVRERARGNLAMWWESGPTAAAGLAATAPSTTSGGNGSGSRALFGGAARDREREMRDDVEGRGSGSQRRGGAPWS